MNIIFNFIHRNVNPKLYGIMKNMIYKFTANLKAMKYNKLFSQIVQLLVHEF